MAQKGEEMKERLSRALNLCQPNSETVNFILCLFYHNLNKKKKKKSSSKDIYLCLSLVSSRAEKLAQ
jgi:hypothetical protein